MSNTHDYKRFVVTLDWNTGQWFAFEVIARSETHAKTETLAGIPKELHDRIIVSVMGTAAPLVKAAPLATEDLAGEGGH